MVILIGGLSSVGKTLMSQRLMEKYRLPYTSIDHIKMGLIRGLPGCPFTEEEDDKAEVFLWPILRGIIMTAIENDQNIILEGCYIPPEKLSDFPSDYLPFIIPYYLCFSEAYLRAHFDLLKSHQSDIEHRGEDDRPPERFIKESLRVAQRAAEAGAKCFVIDGDYERELRRVYDWVDEQVQAVAPRRFC